MSDANDYLMSGGVRSATFTNVGDWVEGFIYQPPDLRQRRDINTKLPMTWNDGNPMMEIRVVLMLDESGRSDEEDDGLRAIYIRGDMQRAVREAVRAAGAAGLEVGGKLRVKHSGLGEPPQRGFWPPKLYEAKYRAPEPEPAQMPEAWGQQPPAYEPPTLDDDIPF